MRKFGWAASAACIAAVLAFAGYALASAVDTGSVSVCSSATVGPQTIQLNGTDVATIPGASDNECATTTYTIPTETITQPVTTVVTQTVTAPAATTTAAPATTTAPATTVATTTTTPASAGADLYLSPAGADANPCTSAAPCLTMSRAYHAAQPGQMVELAAGIYAKQTIAADTSKANATADVTFRAAAGGLAVVQGLTFASGATHITVLGNSPNSELVGAGLIAPPTSGITLRPDPTMLDTGWNVNWNACADNDTVRGVDMQRFFVNGASNFTVDGGSVGGYDNSTGDSALSGPYLGRTSTACQTAKVPSGHITHVLFHDASAPAVDHPDCLQFEGADGVLVDYNAFERCATSDIMDRPATDIWVGNVESNTTFDHNLLTPPTAGGNVIVFGATSDTMGVGAVTNNSCVGQCVSQFGHFQKLTVSGNWWGAITSYACGVFLNVQGASWSNNTFAAKAALCGPGATHSSTMPSPFGP